MKRRLNAVYDQHGRAVYLGADAFDFTDPKFLMTSGFIAAATVAVLVVIKKKKKAKK